LGRKYKIRPELSPGCTAGQLLELVQWPQAKNTVLVVGHQPTLGQTIAQLMGLAETECAVKKGSVWWLRNRERGTGAQTVLVTVQSPEVL
jgi:phosphohistidine phosphatase